MSNDGHSTGTQTVIIGVVFTVMAAAIVSLRLFIRLVVVQTPGWDDCLIFFSLVRARILALVPIPIPRSCSDASFPTSIGFAESTLRGRGIDLWGVD